MPAISVGGGHLWRCGPSPSSTPYSVHWPYVDTPCGLARAAPASYPMTDTAAPSSLPAPSSAEIEALILALTTARGPDRSICPSEVARALRPEWHALLTPVRRAAYRLAAAGQVEVLRKGKPVDPGEVKGVIRLRQVLASPDVPPQPAASVGAA